MSVIVGSPSSRVKLHDYRLVQNAPLVCSNRRIKQQQAAQKSLTRRAVQSAADRVSCRVVSDRRSSVMTNAAPHNRQLANLLQTLVWLALAVSNVQAQCPPVQSPCRCAPSIYEPIAIVCENAGSLVNALQAISAARGVPVSIMMSKVQTMGRVLSLDRLSHNCRHRHTRHPIRRFPRLHHP